MAGRDATEYLQLLLRKAGHTFHTSAELETVKAIKEQRYLLFPCPLSCESKLGSV